MKKIFLMAAAVVALTACQNQTKTESESAEASVVVVEDPVPTVKEVEINVDTVGYTTTASGLRYKAIKEGKSKQEARAISKKKGAYSKLRRN